MSSSFGRLFRVTTFGESHGAAVGCIVDGCPSGLALSVDDIQPALDRRRPGQSALTTSREEADRVEILSGIRDGVTLGTPLALMVRNQDHRPGDYAEVQDVPRPSHADYTYRAKYGIQAASGGGRASARETLARVAAGAVAETLLRTRWGVEIVAWVDAVGDESAEVDSNTVTREQVDAHDVRCPEAEAASRFITAIQAARTDDDSVGGLVACVARGIPAGWGEPIFAKTEALLAGAMLSLPASKGFEIGSGFAGSRMRGSAHNDPFVDRNRSDGQLGTAENRSGGVQGGICNGEPVLFRVAFKPPATIGVAQQTVDYEGRPAVLQAKGRHDPCVVPRAVPIVEAMTALVLADLALQQTARQGVWPGSD
jgi:chorismate synthase